MLKNLGLVVHEPHSDHPCLPASVEPVAAGMNTADSVAVAADVESAVVAAFAAVAPFSLLPVAFASAAFASKHLERSLHPWPQEGDPGQLLHVASVVVAVVVAASAALSAFAGLTQLAGLFEGVAAAAAAFAAGEGSAAAAVAALHSA